MSEYNGDQNASQGQDLLKQSGKNVLNKANNSKLGKKINDAGKKALKKAGKVAVNGAKKLLAALPPQVWAIIGGIVIGILLVYILIISVPFGSMFINANDTTMAEQTEIRLKNAYNAIVQDPKLRMKIVREINKRYNISTDVNYMTYISPDENELGKYKIEDEEECIINISFFPGPETFVQEVNAYANAFNGAITFFDVGSEAHRVVEDKVEITKPFTNSAELDPTERLDNFNDNQVELTEEGQEIIDNADTELSNSNSEKYFDQINRNATKMMYIEENTDEWSMPNAVIGKATKTTNEIREQIASNKTRQTTNTKVEIYDPVKKEVIYSKPYKPIVITSTSMEYSSSTNSSVKYPYVIGKSTKQENWNVVLADIKVYMALDVTKYEKSAEESTRQTFAQEREITPIGEEETIKIIEINSNVITLDTLKQAATGKNIYKKVLNEETNQLEVQKVTTDAQLADTYVNEVISQYYFSFLSMYNGYQYVDGYIGQIFSNGAYKYNTYISQDNLAFAAAYWNYSQSLKSVLSVLPYKSSFNPGSGVPSFTKQCTQFAATMFYDLYGFAALRGDGVNMAENLVHDCGADSDAPVKFALAYSPAPGAVVSLSPNHVIMIDQVDPDGAIYISEGNLANHGIRIHYKLEGGLAQYEREMHKHVTGIAIPIKNIDESKEEE